MCEEREEESERREKRREKTINKKDSIRTRRRRSEK
jgi:hypothetical protein